MHAPSFNAFRCLPAWTACSIGLSGVCKKTQTPDVSEHTGINNTAHCRLGRNHSQCAQRPPTFLRLRATLGGSNPDASPNPDVSPPLSMRSSDADDHLCVPPIHAHIHARTKIAARGLGGAFWVTKLKKLELFNLKLLAWLVKLRCAHCT